MEIVSDRRDRIREQDEIEELRLQVSSLPVVVKFESICGIT